MIVHRPLHVLFCLILCFGFLVGCGHGGGVERQKYVKSETAEGLAAPSAIDLEPFGVSANRYPGPPDVPEEYLLRNGDVVSVRFVHNPELNVDVPVRPDGKITLPLVGPVELQGLDLAQAHARISDRYKDFLVRTGYGSYLKEGDFFDLRFVYNPELNIGVRVRSDGKVSLPLLGDVHASGLRPEELRKRLVALYGRHIKQPDIALLVGDQTARKVFADAPYITVSVAQHAEQHIFVGGEVYKPGVLKFNGRMTTLQAIMEAGGVKDTGDLRQVVVVRNGQFEEPEWVRTDLSKPLYGHSIQNDVVLRNGDVVVVPMSGIAKVDLFVKQYIRDVLPVYPTLGLGF